MTSHLHCMSQICSHTCRLVKMSAELKNATVGSTWWQALMKLLLLCRCPFLVRLWCSWSVPRGTPCSRGLVSSPTLPSAWPRCVNITLQLLICSSWLALQMSDQIHQMTRPAGSAVLDCSQCPMEKNDGKAVLFGAGQLSTLLCLLLNHPRTCFESPMLSSAVMWKSCAVPTA